MRCKTRTWPISPTCMKRGTCWLRARCSIAIHRSVACPSCRSAPEKPALKERDPAIQVGKYRIIALPWMVTVALHPPKPPTGFTRPHAERTGLRNVTFEVDDLQAILGRLAADGYHLVGGVGQYEGVWRMASVRGPEGFIVNLAQRIN